MIGENFQIYSVQITGKYIPLPRQHDLIISLPKNVCPKNEKRFLKTPRPLPHTHTHTFEGRGTMQADFSLKIYKI